MTWLRPPPADRPGDVLRWTRRVSLATAGLLLVGAALAWPDDHRVSWLVVAAVAVVVVNAATMGPAIRRADERGPVTDPDERARLRDRNGRRTVALLAVVLLGGPAIGYALYGAEGTVIPLVASLLWVAVYLGARRAVSG